MHSYATHSTVYQKTQNSTDYKNTILFNTLKYCTYLFLWRLLNTSIIIWPYGRLTDSISHSRYIHIVTYRAQSRFAGLFCKRFVSAICVYDDGWPTCCWFMFPLGPRCQEVGRLEHTIQWGITINLLTPWKSWRLKVQGLKHFKMTKRGHIKLN